MDNTNGLESHVCCFPPYHYSKPARETPYWLVRNSQRSKSIHIHFHLFRQSCKTLLSWVAIVGRRVGWQKSESENSFELSSNSWKESWGQESDGWCKIARVMRGVRVGIAPYRPTTQGKWHKIKIKWHCAQKLKIGISLNCNIIMVILVIITYTEKGKLQACMIQEHSRSFSAFQFSDFFQKSPFLPITYKKNFALNCNSIAVQ